jgi:hypothetical protein
LWRLLQTSRHVSALPVEGQFIETVEPHIRKAPWNPQHDLPWPIIKTEWEAVWDMDRRILLEKSPPHLLRAPAIEQAFDPAHFIVMVRNPYAFCEGTKRRGRVGLGYRRDASYGEIARGWIRETQLQVQNLQQLQRTLCLTYEELTDRPEETAEKLLAFMPGLERLDIQASHFIHSVAGWLDRPLTNLNPAQIARLSAGDIAEINRVLSEEPELLAHFGYHLQTGAYPGLSRIRLSANTLFTRHVTRTFQRLGRRVGSSASRSNEGE